jgi:hypothetical protein
MGNAASAGGLRKGAVVIGWHPWKADKRVWRDLGAVSVEASWTSQTAAKVYLLEHL